MAENIISVLKKNIYLISIRYLRHSCDALSAIIKSQARRNIKYRYSNITSPPSNVYIHMNNETIPRFKLNSCWQMKIYNL